MSAFALFSPDLPLLIQGVCLGIVLALGLSFLGLFRTLHDRAFLYYAGFVLGMGFHFLATVGNGPSIAAPTDWSLHSIAFLATATLAAVSYPLFIRQFLLPARLHEWLERPLLWLGAAHAAGPLVALAGGWALWSGWSAALSVPVTALTLSAMIVAWRRGYRPAGLLLLATASMAASCLVYVAPIFGLPPVQEAEAIVQLGVAMQALVLGWAIARRVRTLQADRRRAREAQARAEATSEGLREALRLKANLLGFAAHDLRSPLAAIVGFADLIDEEAPNAALREYAGHIQSSANRLRRLVDDLLVTAELDSGDASVTTEPTDLGLHVAEAARPFAALADVKGQRLSVYAPAGFIVRLDAHRFREVVDNLLSNAVKYTPPGGSISVEVEGTETYARVSVQDSGPGFSPADRAGLFRPFQRLSARPTGGEPSTGLGLAIVKQVVDLHEGDVRVESPPAGGARLTVTLPVAQPRALPLAA